MQRLIYLLLTTIVLLSGLSGAHAAQLGPTSSLTQKYPVTVNSGQILLAQSTGRLSQTKPPCRGHNCGGKPPGKKPPGGGGGRPDIGVGIGIGIGIIDAINRRPKTPPPYYTQPKPKKKYTRKPPRKPVRKARRTPPRQPVPVVQPIPEFLPNEVVVLIDNTQPPASDDAIGASFGYTKLSSTPSELLEGRFVRYRIPANTTVQQAVTALTADPRVSMAASNKIYLTSAPNSRKASVSAQYAFAKLGLTPAHTLSLGRKIPVAVIDTGVDATHPVLAGSIAKSFDAVQDGKPRAQKHGTAIAGLIAGRGKVTGVAPQASLFAVRAFYMHPVYKRPVTSSDVLLRSFEWAYQNKARIFNMSFAGPYDPLVQAALTSAHNKGVILIAAAGNGGPRAKPAYPGAYENVIAITALDSKDKLYAHANRGEYLAAAAPGVDVLVPSLNKGYTYSSGTSLAAAHVSGLVALLLEQNPQVSAQKVREILMKTARDLGPKGHDSQYGAGLADAHASLLSLKKGDVVLTSGK